MKNEKYGVREAYQDWRALSPDTRKELKSQAIRSMGRGLIESMKDLVITAAVVVPLMIGAEGLAYGLSKIKTPTATWNSRVYENEAGATVLEREYNTIGGIIRYIDRDSNGLDLGDDVFQYIPRVGQFQRKATEQDITVFDATLK